MQGTNLDLSKFVTFFKFLVSLLSCFDLYPLLSSVYSRRYLLTVGFFLCQIGWVSFLSLDHGFTSHK
jgi:hypothetical protein